MQSRIGPYRVGPHGLLQPIADALKLHDEGRRDPGGGRPAGLQPRADRVPDPVHADLRHACRSRPGSGSPTSTSASCSSSRSPSMEIVGLFMGGWGSNNKYALLSAMRAVNQIISYDLPFIFAALVPVVLAGSLRLSDIAAAQAGMPSGSSSIRSSASSRSSPSSWRPLAAENRVPFDILEAESELVAGLPRRVLGDEVRADPARRVRARDRHVVPRRAAVPRRVGRAAVRSWLGPRRGSCSRPCSCSCSLTWIRWSFVRIRVDQILRRLVEAAAARDACCS